MAEQDTEILLALLSSLLSVPVDDHSTLLNALVESDGNVERAAALLNSRVSANRPSSTNGLKRKRNTRLDSWLSTQSTSNTPKTRTKHETTPDNILPPSPSKRHVSTPPSSDPPEDQVPSTSSPRKVKAVTQQEFMCLLRPPNSTEPKTQGPPKFPPLTLTTPAMIAKHTPCTMHLSILPPELASR